MQETKPEDEILEAFKVQDKNKQTLRLPQAPLRTAPSNGRSSIATATASSPPRSSATSSPTSVGPTPKHEPMQCGAGADALTGVPGFQDHARRPHKSARSSTPVGAAAAGEDLEDADIDDMVNKADVDKDGQALRPPNTHAHAHPLPTWKDLRASTATGRASTRPGRSALWDHSPFCQCHFDPGLFDHSLFDRDFFGRGRRSATRSSSSC